MKFDHNAALEGSQENKTYITDSGNYEVTILDAIRLETQRYLRYDIQVITNDDKISNLRIFVENEKGNIFGYNIFQSLLGILKINELTYKVEGDDQKVPLLKGRKIGVALQKEYYYGNDGQEKWRLNTRRFFHMPTHKTYTEIVNNTEAKSWDYVYNDKHSKKQDASYDYNTNVKPDNVIPF